MPRVRRLQPESTYSAIPLEYLTSCKIGLSCHTEERSTLVSSKIEDQHRIMALTPRLKAALYVLAALGLYGTWGRTILDGTLERLLTALRHGHLHIMSGTNEPLLTSITGIYWPVDCLLDILILFFWEAADGSHPSTTLVALYFAGQHLCIVVLLYIDSLRSGNRDKWKIG